MHYQGHTLFIYNFWICKVGVLVSSGLLNQAGLTKSTPVAYRPEIPGLGWLQVSLDRELKTCCLFSLHLLGSVLSPSLSFVSSGLLQFSK